MMPAEETANSERFNARMPTGTSQRISRVLYGGELPSAFFRRAVENELQRREADKRLHRGYFSLEDDN